MAPSKQRILICEDDDALVELLQVRFELAGYLTFVARDGAAAVAAAREARPHAIVLDIGLPIMDGFRVLAMLKADPRVKDVPVLMLTARHEAGDVQKSIKAGARDYLTKPFDDKVLLARVARLIATAPKPAAPEPAAEPDEGEITYL